MSGLSKYLNSIKKYTPMTRKEEKEWFIKYKNGCPGAKDFIIQSNLRFVVSVAKQYTNQGLEFDDLISEGNVGLIKACDKFDYTKNFKFITYAVWWIRQSILEALREYRHPIRLPANKYNEVTKANKRKDRLEQEEGRHIDIYSDLSLEYLNIVKIDEERTENGKTLNSVLKSDEKFDFEISTILDEINKAILNLKKDHQKIIKMYYGIGYDRPHTLEEIGEKLNLTRERIRQIKINILEELKRSDGADLLRSCLEYE